MERILPDSFGGKKSAIWRLRRSAIPEVRAKLLELQRDYGKRT